MILCDPDSTIVVDYDEDLYFRSWLHRLSFCGPKIDFFFSKQSIVVINHWLNVILLIILNLHMPTADMQFKKPAKCFTSPCVVMLCDWHLVSQNHMFAYVNLCDLHFYTLCSFLINTLRMFPRVGEHTHTSHGWIAALHCKYAYFHEQTTLTLIS